MLLYTFASIIRPQMNQTIHGHKPELVVMLTHHDYTVGNAAEIFEQCRQSKARFWGFKEHPLPFDEMRALYARMKACGKTTFLEVVAYTEAEGLAGAQMAADCCCDILMGTVFHESILHFCQQHAIRYMPFVGRVEGRPSVLSGSISELVAEAQATLVMGTVPMTTAAINCWNRQGSSQARSSSIPDSEANP